MIARCGSTLTCQMMSNVPKTKVISEPYGGADLVRLLNQSQISQEKYEQLVQAWMRIMCKADHQRPHHQIFIKSATLYPSIFPTIAKLFPEVSLVFNARTPVPHLKSYKKTITLNGTQNLFLRLGSLFRFLMSSKAYLDGQDAEFTEFFVAKGCEMRH